MNYFNSIKVRLKPAGSDPVGADPSFQFHKGTIKTALTAKGNTLRNYFNSIKVRLKPCWQGYCLRKEIISIP